MHRLWTSATANSAICEMIKWTITIATRCQQTLVLALVVRWLALTAQDMNEAVMTLLRMAPLELFWQHTPHDTCKLKHSPCTFTSSFCFSPTKSVINQRTLYFISVNNTLMLYSLQCGIKSKKILLRWVAAVFDDEINLGTEWILQLSRTVMHSCCSLTCCWSLITYYLRSVPFGNETLNLIVSFYILKEPLASKLIGISYINSRNTRTEEVIFTNK